MKWLRTSTPPAKRVRGFIDRFDRLTITGWAVGAAGDTTGLELFCAGRPLAFQIRRRQRADVAETLGVLADQPYGFEVELGPEVWSRFPDGDRPGLMLDLRANGLALAPAVTLTREHLGQWLESLRAASDKAASQNELIRALLHVAWAGGPQVLSPELAMFVRDEANARGWLEALSNPSLASAAMKPVVLEGLVESFKDLHFKGWAIDLHRDAESFSLQCNGTRLPVEAVRTGRGDVRTALGVKRLELGFELALPSSIWRAAGPSTGCNLDILVNGSPLLGGPFRFDRPSLDAAIARVRMSEHSPQGQPMAAVSTVRRHYLLMRLVEHVSEAGGPGTLALPNAIYMRGVAARFGMEHLFDVPASPVGFERAEGDATAQDLSLAEQSGELIWRLQRRFNQLVQPDGANAALALEQTVSISGLRGQERMRLLATLVPFFCQVDRFRELAPWIDMKAMLAIAESGDVWHRSLLLPVLMHAGEIDAAVESMRQLSARLEHGWLNTECVLEAAREAVKCGESGGASGESMAHFLLASLSLLEALGPVPWSRRQDANLVQTIVHLLHHDWLWPDDLRGRLAESALRLYGLTPEFWQRWVSQSPVIRASPASKLALAQKSFNRLHTRFQAIRRLELSELPGLLDALEPFRQCGNPDVDVFERELHQAVAAELFRDAEATALAVRRLARVHPAEPLRLASFPGARDQPAAVSSLGDIEERILVVSSVPLAAHSALQAEALRRIGQLAAMGAGATVDTAFSDLAAGASQEDCLGAGSLPDADLTALYDQLLPLLGPLKQASAGCVGYELHVLAWLSVRHQIQDDGARLETLRRTLLEAPQQSATGRVPPPGLTGALALLELDALSSRCGTMDDEVGSHRNAPLAASAAELRARLGERDGVLAMEWPGQNTALSSEVSCVGNAFRHMLVMVRVQVDRRAAQIANVRSTWGAELEALGVALVFVVSATGLSTTAEAERRDGLLTLNLSYPQHEHPRQVLAMLDWACRSMDFTRILQIDADCQVQVSRLFAAQPWAAHHYHGRRAQRVDCNGRSETDGAVLLERGYSHADSRAGYTLTRYAVGALLAQSTTMAGQAIVQASSSEDQLVGDLLDRAGIVLSDEGYPTLVRQRVDPSGRQELGAPVPPNAFHVGLNSPTLVMHVGNPPSEGALRRSTEVMRASLTPERIWPTLFAPSLGNRADHNQLELMSPLDRVRALGEAPLTVVAVARNEVLLLPHFLAHYRLLGVRHFVIVDNLSDDGTCDYLARQPDVVLYCADTEYRHSNFGVAWQQAVLGAHGLGKWVLLADIDEFLIYPGCETKPLPALIDTLSGGGFDAACVHMVDMYPEGALTTADFSTATPFQAAPWFDRQPLVHWKLGSGCYSNAPTWLSALRHRLIAHSAPNAYTSQKIALLRYQPWVRLSAGLHYASGLNVAPEPLQFAHFKYHAGFAQKVADEVRRKQHFNDAAEYLNYASLVAEAGGRLFDTGLSSKYVTSSSFNRLIQSDETA